MRVCFGKFFKRPAENLVHRLVDFWQIAQPLHLRHFAVVRDMAMAKTVMFYVHYSADNFAILVDEGRAAWEAVEFPAKKAKSLKINLPPYGARPNLDEFGFPANVFPRGLLKNPYSTLRDGMAAVKPADYTLSSSDPFIAELANGECVVRRRQDKRPVGTKQLQTGSSIARPRGRPSHEETAKRARELESKEPKEQSPEENLTGAYGLEEIEDLPPPKRAKKKIRDMTGMTKKEKFEALGMDINWTEYNALLMEKPTPGIYVSPHGGF
jgi:transcription factor C subunit 3